MGELASEAGRRLRELQAKSQEYFQMVSAIEGKFEQKENEIKVLEDRLSRLKVSVQETQDKANAILQEASNASTKDRQEAKRILEEVQMQKSQVDDDKRKAQSLSAEAQELYKQAVQKLKEADVQSQIYLERKKKIEEAIR